MIDCAQSHSAEPHHAEQRGAARCRAILLATLDQLAEVGYERLTIDAVATAAHASKATIYRRWKGKADLVVDAVGQWPGSELRTPDTGSLRDDLLTLLRTLATKLRSKQETLFVGLIHAAKHDPALATKLRERTHQQAMTIYREVITRARERGEITGCGDPELVITLAPAVLFYRYLLTGDPVDEQLLTTITDEILLPLLCGRAAEQKPEL